MNAKFVQIKNQKIAYYESAGASTSPDSPGVLFVHGNSSSNRSFLRQIESRLCEKYRLTALDLPGHGMSVPAHDPQSTYTVAGLAGIITEFAERLSLQNAFFVGCSSGGNLLLEAIDRLSVKGCMLVGSFPAPLPLDMSKIALPTPTLASLFKEDLTDHEIYDWTAALMKPGANPPAFLEEDIRKTDKSFRTIFGEAVACGCYKDEVSITADLNTPLALVLGAEEQLLRVSYLRSLSIPSLWRSDVQIIPDAGHFAQWEQPERFNNLLESFVEDIE